MIQDTGTEKEQGSIGLMNDIRMLDLMPNVTIIINNTEV